MSIVSNKSLDSECVENFMTGPAQFRSLLRLAIVLCMVGAIQAQTPPGSPVALSSSSAKSPKVTYVDGQLTISALDASLGDVLRAVSVKTGAVIEFPADRGREHLFANAGPGPVREVLASLLNGSRFNYVMLASPTDPGILQRMILTSSDDPASQTAAVEIPPPVIQPFVAPSAGQVSKALPLPAIEQESQQIEMEAPKEPLSPDAIEAMMKARREARKLQRQQEAGSSQ